MSLTKTRFSVFIAILLLITSFAFSFSINSASAETRVGTANSTVDSSQTRLRNAVDEYVKDKAYTSKTGDTIKGSQIVKRGMTNDNFTKLTSKEQQRLIDDMRVGVTNQQNKDVKNNATNPVTDDTVTNWLKELQQNPGVGSKLLGNITSQIKPDYVTGQRIMEPFNGPINTIIALVAILIMSGLAVTFVADLAYLNIPIFQSFIVSSMSDKGGGGNGGSRYTNFFVGREAIQAIEDSENDSNGKQSNPNWLYMKKRFIGLMFLGICLLYLVQGQIFALVGMLMDLLGGFLD